MNQSDQLAAMAAVLYHLHLERVPGVAGTGSMTKLARLRTSRFGLNGTTRLAKLVGATPAQVTAWERGDLVPTTGQLLALFAALYGPRAEVLDDAQ